MGNLNQVNIIGRLTRDVELTYTPKGVSVARMSVAINQKFTTASGEKRERVTFVDVEAWASLADICAKFLAKGRSVFISGRLDADTWEDKETGKKRTKIKVTAENVQFIDSETKPQGRPREGQADDDEAPF